MSAQATSIPTKRRAMSKQDRREQLIKATIKCIANNGLSGTTMADVTREAGLSLGIVNLHFQSKEKLLIETLRYIDHEYKTGWDKIIASSANATEKVTALVEFDFSAQIAKLDKIAVWYAFWGEANSRPTYQKICAKHDNDIAATFADLCEQLIAEGKYRHVDPDIVATGYTALADGLWLDLLLTPKELSKNKAKRICMSYLATNFPRHFSIA